jgi:NDP-sugar pyrophosphorylase family protein
MKALILAAGLGTRLQPLTDTIPKALVKVDGMTLLEHALRHVSDHGISDVIVNMHHFPDQIINFLGEHGNLGLNIAVSDESDKLLETGGGIKKAGWFLDGSDPFLVRNVDIISDLDLTGMISFHRQTGALATLAVRHRETSRYLLFDDQMQLSGWENRKTGETKISRFNAGLAGWAFSGIHVISPEIFPLLTETGPFSITDAYLRLAADHIILGFPDTGHVWRDAGNINTFIME